MQPWKCLVPRRLKHQHFIPEYLNWKNVTCWLVWSAENSTFRARLRVTDRIAVDVCTCVVSKVGVTEQKQNIEADQLSVLDAYNATCQLLKHIKM
jgi:hypothetical protein